MVPSTVAEAEPSAVTPLELRPRALLLLVLEPESIWPMSVSTALLVLVVVDELFRLETLKPGAAASWPAATPARRPSSSLSGSAEAGAASASRARAARGGVRIGFPPRVAGGRGGR